MKNKVDLKVCVVCGDKALGYNFNAVTCESCKAFFRRNALTQKEFRCPFTNDCKITTVTRRFCQKCRLDKCFAKGMRKDLILSDDEKAQKRQKIEENRAKKRCGDTPETDGKRMKKEPSEADSELYNTDSNQDTNSSEGYQPNNPNIEAANLCFNEDLSSGSVPSTHNDVATPHQNITQHLYDSATTSNSINNFSQIEQALINNLLKFRTDTAHDGQNVNTASLENATDVSKDVIEDVGRINNHNSYYNPIDSILSEAIKLEYETYSPLAQTNSQSRQLNEAERAKLNELINANKAFLTPIEEELNLIGNEYKDVVKDKLPANQQPTDPALLDVINLTALGIRRLIKMSKKISAFKNMCQEDQVALLKGGCTEIMMIISARRYDPTKNTWRIPSIQESLTINVDVLKLAKGNAYQELEQFIRTFDTKWRADENIILILCAIVLFTPDRPRVVHQDVIKLEQSSYYYLLRRYLESTYEGCEAKSNFLRLIQKITELHKVNEELINVLLDVNPSQVEPLLKEIFDIK